MNNTAELENNTRRKPDVYHLTTEVAVLKSQNRETEKHLDRIDDSLREINKTMANLATEVTTSIAAAGARHKLWLFIFSLAGAATVLLKLFGVDV